LTGKPLIKHTQGLPSLHNSCVPTGSHVAWHRLYSVGSMALYSYWKMCSSVNFSTTHHPTLQFHIFRKFHHIVSSTEKNKEIIWTQGDV